MRSRETNDGAGAHTLPRLPIGMRLVEVLPTALPVRQFLLELNHPLGRLEIVQAFLAQYGLER
jgi:hypothetical protein